MFWAAPRVEKRSSGRASSRGNPRTWSATRRALRGATLTKRALALTTGRSAGSFALALLSAFGLAAVFFAAGFFAAGFLAAGFLAVAVSAALVSAVFEGASGAPLPFVAVSLRLGFAASLGLAAGLFPRGAAAGFLGRLL